MKIKLGEVVTRKVLADYLCGEFGETLGIYKDGSHCVGDLVGMEIDEEERPIYTAECIGVQNMCHDKYIDFYDCDNKTWSINDGVEAEINEVLRYECENGDVDEDIEILIGDLRRSGNTK